MGALGHVFRGDAPGYGDYGRWPIGAFVRIVGSLVFPSFFSQAFISGHQRSGLQPESCPIIGVTINLSAFIEVSFCTIAGLGSPIFF
jgi:hypothetical protein